MRMCSKVIVKLAIFIFLSDGVWLQAGETNDQIWVNVLPLSFGVARPGAVLPIAVDVVNQATGFVGEIEAWSGDYESAAVVSQTINIGRGKFRFFMYPQVASQGTDELFVRIVNHSGRVVASQSISLKPKQGKTWVGIYCGKGRAFAQQDIPDNSVAVMSIYRPELLPDRWYGYKFLDVLFWDGHEDVTLSKDQRTAMEGWVAGGGRLILTAREGDKILIPPFMVIASSLALVSEQEHNQILGLKMFFSAREFPAAKGALFAEMKYGLGTVVLLRIDSTGVPLLPKNALSSLLTGPANVKLDGKVDPNSLSPNQWAQPSSMAGNLKSLLARSAGYTELAFRPLLFTMLFYIFMVSIVEYLVLRRLGKLAWTWAVFPLQIVGFSVFSFFAFYQGQLGGRELHKLVFHDIANDGKSRIIALTCIRKNTTRPFDFKIEGTHFISTLGGSETGDYNMNRYQSRIQTSFGTVIRERNISSTEKQILIPGYVSSFKFFTEEWLLVETNLPFSCSLAVNGSRLSGTVRSNLSVPTFAMFMLFKDRIYSVEGGNIKSNPKQVTEIAMQLGETSYFQPIQSGGKIDLKQLMVDWVKSSVSHLICRFLNNILEEAHFRSCSYPGVDDMIPHFLRGDEAILFAFCEEKADYHGVVVKGVRCYRQIIDVGISVSGKGVVR